MFDPDRLPKKLDLELSAETAQRIKTLAERTGRSEDEIILELIDRGLQRP